MKVARRRFAPRARYLICRGVATSSSYTLGTEATSSRSCSSARKLRESGRPLIPHIAQAAKSPVEPRTTTGEGGEAPPQLTVDDYLRQATGIGVVGTTASGPAAAGQVPPGSNAIPTCRSIGRLRARPATRDGVPVTTAVVRAP
jgi:hypothetical protein